MYMCLYYMLALIWQLQFFMLAQPLLYALFSFALTLLYLFLRYSLYNLSVDCASRYRILNGGDIHPYNTATVDFCCFLYVY